ncbi:hypothetical protein [Rothia nasimurium]|uniref:hypothetical protein n=1 Tax=Rothia nasimurium TaxID=85336 RepID=UPI001F48EDAA|nr:hypothetical protein [Rothia nasimurium]
MITARFKPQKYRLAPGVKGETSLSLKPIAKGGAQGFDPGGKRCSVSKMGWQSRNRYVIVINESKMTNSTKALMVHSSQWKLWAHAGLYRTPDAVYRVKPQMIQST